MKSVLARLLMLSLALGSAAARADLKRAPICNEFFKRLAPEKLVQSFNEKAYEYIWDVRNNGWHYSLLKKAEPLDPTVSPLNGFFTKPSDQKSRLAFLKVWNIHQPLVRALTQRSKFFDRKAYELSFWKGMQESFWRTPQLLATETFFNERLEFRSPVTFVAMGMAGSIIWMLLVDDNFDEAVVSTVYDKLDRNSPLWDEALAHDLFYKWIGEQGRSEGLDAAEIRALAFQRRLKLRNLHRYLEKKFLKDSLAKRKAKVWDDPFFKPVRDLAEKGVNTEEGVLPQAHFQSLPDESRLDALIRDHRVLFYELNFAHAYARDRKALRISARENPFLKQWIANVESREESPFTAAMISLEAKGKISPLQLQEILQEEFEFRHRFFRAEIMGFKLQKKILYPEALPEEVLNIESAETFIRDSVLLRTKK